MTKTVIIVDDSAVMRAQLRDMLADQGFHLMAEAETGKQAIEYIQNLKPDLVLLDVVLPDITAREVLIDLRKTLPALRVLIISGLDADPVVQELLQNGASGYLVKPVSPEMLAYAIKQLEAPAS